MMIGIASWISGTCFRGQHRAGSATALGGSRHGWLLGAVVTLMVLGAADQAYAQCSGAGTPTVTCGGTVVNPGQNCQNVSDIRTAGPHVVWQCNEASQRAIYSNTQSGTQGIRRLSQLAQSNQQFARLTPDNGELGRGNIYWHFGNVNSTTTVYGARIDGSRVRVRMTQTANLGPDQLALSSPFPFQGVLLWKYGQIQGSTQWYVSCVTDFGGIIAIPGSSTPGVQLTEPVRRSDAQPFVLDYIHDGDNRVFTVPPCPGASLPNPCDTITCNDGNVCTQDICNPSNGSCAFTPVPDGTVACRAKQDVCDVSDFCVSGGCPDTIEPSTTVCRDNTVINTCDIVDRCTGTDKSCPPDARDPDGTPCNDFNGCSVGDLCGAGSCIPGAPPDCLDIDPCTDDLCVATSDFTFFCDHPPETVPPTLIVDVFNLECDESTAPQPPVSTDACDPAPTEVLEGDVIVPQSCPQDSRVLRSWTLTDFFGNVALPVQVFNLVDTTAPTFVPPPDVSIRFGESQLPAETGAPLSSDASDNCAGSNDITFTFTDAIEPGSRPEQFTITRTWTGTDPCGNPTEETQIIKVGQTLALVIDEDSIDNGSWPNFFSDVDVNDDIADIGLRTQLRFFAANLGNIITLFTGEVGDEGWFVLPTTPDSWEGADPNTDGITNYIVAGPGLGSPDANGDREALLDKIPDVTPLRATGLMLLEGENVCAVVYDSDISINYDPLDGSLKGANLGTVAFEVLSVTPLTGFSSSFLPEVEILILDADELCEDTLTLFEDAPKPISSSEPFDVGE